MKLNVRKKKKKKEKKSKENLVYNWHKVTTVQGSSVVMSFPVCMQMEALFNREVQVRRPGLSPGFVTN